MTLLVFGKTGQVAQELKYLIPEAVFLSRTEADLSNPDACRTAVSTHKPDLIINAAAYTDVDGAEDEETFATRVNGAGPTVIAEVAATLGIPFIHISTDYVFDGSGTVPWDTFSHTAPLGAYGRSKLNGEQGIQAAGGVYAILRTAWVFSAHGNNFVKTMLRLAKGHSVLSIVADQRGGPTPAADIARAVLSIGETIKINPEKTGVYHFSGAPDISWADFAREIFYQSKKNIEVKDIKSSDFSTKAVRPKISMLDCGSTKAQFGIMRSDWRQGLALVLKDLGEI